jgi:spore germination cell wall hydrolase CwlJ-like protein
MRAIGTEAVLRAAMVLLVGAALSACTTAQKTTQNDQDSTSSKTKLQAGPAKHVYTYTAEDRDCLKRAMYFESQRSSETGFLAVGSVIMNRLTSGIYPPTICGVVSQKKQFAPGVMTRKMDEASAPVLAKTADAVLKGERHPNIKEAMFFHQKGLRFGYDNIHYTAAAGGNVFYEKRGPDGKMQTAEPKPVDQYVLAYAGSSAAQGGVAFMTASTPATSPPTVPTTSSAATAVATANVTTTSVAVASPSTASAIAPAVTAEIARANVARAFDASFAVPRSPEPEARSDADSLSTTVPVPIQRPNEQKRVSAGTRADLVMAEPATRSGVSHAAMSYDNWTMRTGTW